MAISLMNCDNQRTWREEFRLLESDAMLCARIFKRQIEDIFLFEEKKNEKGEQIKKAKQQILSENTLVAKKGNL
jgi:hypothetical protein